MCIACHKSFGVNDKIISVRIEDNMGYNISSMCEPCMNAVKVYKERKKLLLEI